MSRSGRRFAAALLLLPAALLLSGCVGRTAVRAVTPHGTVLSPTEDASRALAERFLADRDGVLALLPGADDGPVEIRQLGGALPGLPGVRGTTFARRPGSDTPRRILLAADADGLTLAHELVHAYLPADLQDLPPVLEEALAEWISARLHPAHPRWLVHSVILAAEPLHLALTAADGSGGRAAFRVIELDFERPDDAPDAATLLRQTGARELHRGGPLGVAWSYALGHRMATRGIDRLGLDGWLAAVREASTTGAWAAFEGDGAPPSPGESRRTQRAALRECALRLDAVASNLRDLVAERRQASESALDCLRRLAPRLELDTGAPIELLRDAGLERFARALDD